MTIGTKECLIEICDWMNKNHDSLSSSTEYLDRMGYYTSGKKAKHWRRRGIFKEGDITMRVFERQCGDEEITPTMILVDLPEEYLVTYNDKNSFLRMEFMSLAQLTKLKIKVKSSIVGYLNCDDDGNFYPVKEIEEVSQKLKF